jgi:endogenous inhibitor of DNA gyrase (YacG/DUF329 family)
MYCPRCGQQQISDEMKFCSRCGLPMTGLAEWLAGRGASSGRGTETQVSLRSPRRKGIRRGAKLMFLSGVLFLVFLVLSLVIDEGAPMIIPIIIFFVALIMMLYARLFSEEISPIKSQQSQTSGLGAMSGGSALPTASNIPTNGHTNLAGQQVRTNELAQPPSVTEHTTRLLDKE